LGCGNETTWELDAIGAAAAPVAGSASSARQSDSAPQRTLLVRRPTHTLADYVGCGHRDALCVRPAVVVLSVLARLSE
jgi:hypothetical protein